MSQLEPNIIAKYSLYFPTSGVIDSHQFMSNLLNDSKVNGADIAYKVEIIDINKIDNGYEIIAIDADLNQISFTSRIVINSSGLYAKNISDMVGIIEPEYNIEFWKGE